MSRRIVIAGGGAAGFFAAITVAEADPHAQVLLLERGREVLGKVRISGGGRCNLTHDCPDPRELVRAYPRGHRELLGPFHRFGPTDTIAWFAQRGVATKTEADGRMFPQSDDAQTIIDCLVQAARRAGVEVRTQAPVTRLVPPPEPEAPWRIYCGDTELEADRLMLATGSSTRIWDLLADLGHSIVPPVPSLFTFQIEDARLEGLAGLSVPAATLAVAGESPVQGPVLITHWGLSGPAVLRLSAWAARTLHACDYRCTLAIDWLGLGKQGAEAWVEQARRQAAAKALRRSQPDALPLRLWERLLQAAGIDPALRWADLTRVQMQALADQLAAGSYAVRGKSTFKEEFVTAGGVDLREVDFRHFASRRLPGLFLAGEILDIDAITGGYNFQAAWTGGWHAGLAMVS
ncbi:MAG: NAD(P)/FAD-dependent oxidoreductase [Bacteroidia bacterium]